MIAEQDFFGKKNSVIANHTWSGSGRVALCSERLKEHYLGETILSSLMMEHKTCLEM